MSNARMRKNSSLWPSANIGEWFQERGFHRSKDSEGGQKGVGGRKSAL